MHWLIGLVVFLAMFSLLGLWLFRMGAPIRGRLFAAWSIPYAASFLLALVGTAVESPHYRYPGAGLAEIGVMGIVLSIYFGIRFSDGEPIRPRVVSQAPLRFPWIIAALAPIDILGFAWLGGEWRPGEHGIQGGLVFWALCLCLALPNLLPLFYSTSGRSLGAAETEIPGGDPADEPVAPREADPQATDTGPATGGGPAWDGEMAVSEIKHAPAGLQLSWAGFVFVALKLTSAAGPLFIILVQQMFVNAVLFLGVVQWLWAFNYSRRSWQSARLLATLFSFFVGVVLAGLNVMTQLRSPGWDIAGELAAAWLNHRRIFLFVSLIGWIVGCWLVKAIAGLIRFGVRIPVWYLELI